jgi:peptide-methionine (R)-S-oxide reductase
MTQAQNQSKLGYDLSPLAPEERRRLEDLLDPEAARILLKQGTEPPFCGRFHDHKADGVYNCALCTLPLFDSKTKFQSKSGWPSFYAPISDDHIVEVTDLSHGWVRTEIVCGRCHGHLGHVFDDGPAPTYQRYCLNSVALHFQQK